MNLSSTMIKSVCIVSICLSLISCSFPKLFPVPPPTEDLIKNDDFVFQYLAKIKNIDDLKELSQHLSRVESIRSASDLNKQLEQIALKEKDAVSRRDRLRKESENGQRQLFKMNTERDIAIEKLYELRKDTSSREKRIDVLKATLK